MRIFKFFVLLLLLSSFGKAPCNYDTDLPSAAFHRSRREALRALMPDSSVAVFFAGPVRTRSNDVEYDFKQDPDFYYLTGLNETDAALLIFKNKVHIDTLYTDELLFVQDRDPGQEAWTGRRLGVNGAKQELGFDHVLSARQFNPEILDFTVLRHLLFKPIPVDVRPDAEDPCSLALLLGKFRNKAARVPGADTVSLLKFMAQLRQVKQPVELAMLKKAISISCAAHIELMKAMEPDMTEYQVQAIVEYEFKKRGAEYPGYPSICGSGENSCILHYTTNRRQMKPGDLIVVDAGAEYHGYSSDITRTLPASGKYSPEQKAIYAVVEEAQQAGIDQCRKGNDFYATHSAAVNVIRERLLQLGIIKNGNDYERYFFHGTSHYIGLDVHDAGLYGPLEPGEVITVEPGIYIPEGSPCDPKWWNIGIRIEDDILITAGDPVVLSASIPRDPSAIEQLMAQKSYLDGK